MSKEELTRLYDDLLKLDNNKITIVTYEDHQLVYRQMDRIVMIPYLRLYFYPRDKFKFGILTSRALQGILIDIKSIIADQRFGANMLLSVPNKWKIDFLGLVQPLEGPQTLYEIPLVSITDSLLVRLVVSYKAENRVLFKSVKQIAKDRLNKVQEKILVPKDANEE